MSVLSKNYDEHQRDYEFLVYKIVCVYNYKRHTV